MFLISCLFIIWISNFVIPQTIKNITYNHSNESTPIENILKKYELNVLDLKLNIKDSNKLKSKIKNVDFNKKLKIKRHLKKRQTSIPLCLLQLKVGCIDHLARYSVSKEFKSSKGTWFKVLIDLFGKKVNLTLRREREQRIFVNLSQINQNQTFNFEDKGRGQSTNANNIHTSGKTHIQYNNVSGTTYSHNSNKSDKSNGETKNMNKTSNSKKMIIKNIYTGHLDLYRNSYFHGSYTSKQGLKGTLESEGAVYKLTPATINNISQVKLGYQIVNIEVIMIDQADWAYDWEEEEVRRKRDEYISKKRHEKLRKRVNTDQFYGENLKIMSNITSGNKSRQSRRKTRSKRYILYDDENYDYDYNEDENTRTYRVCTINYRISLNYYANVCQNSIQVCVDRALWMIDFVNRFFRRTDFNFDGHLDNIGFVLNNLAVLDDIKYDQEHDSKKLLQLFSGDNLPTACMNLLLVDHVLNEGVLGLAYIPRLSNGASGGICNDRYSSNLNNYNALLASERSLEGAVSNRHIAITIMHELGHAFGAPHDVLGRCTAYRFVK